MSKSNNITDLLRSVADAIRYKNGTLSSINPQDFYTEIIQLPGESSAKLRGLIDKSIVSIGVGDFGPITMIGSDSFSNCTNLATVEMSNTITSIGSGAFVGCSSLTNAVFSTSLRTIGSQAFLNCTSLQTVDLGSSVTSIGSQAFNSCNSLLSFTVRATTPPSLLNSNALSYTNNCPIYVPAQSVNAYKTETNWIAYASRIQAIQ